MGREPLLLLLPQAEGSPTALLKEMEPEGVGGGSHHTIGCRRRWQWQRDYLHGQSQRVSWRLREHVNTLLKYSVTGERVGSDWTAWAVWAQI